MKRLLDSGRKTDVMQQKYYGPLNWQGYTKTKSAPVITMTVESLQLAKTLPIYDLLQYLDRDELTQYESFYKDLQTYCKKNKRPKMEELEKRMMLEEDFVAEPGFFCFRKILMFGKNDFKNYACQYHLFPRLSTSFLTSKTHLSSEQRHKYS